MPIIATLGALTSKAWGQFKAAVAGVGGRLYFWGSNGNGEYGNNEVSGTYSATPLQVSPDISAPATPVTINYFDTALAQIRGDGSLWAWGVNTYGQNGDSSTVDKSSPVQIGTLTNWRKIGVGNQFATSIKSDGTLWAWGRNTHGQLGNGLTIERSSPIQIGTLTNWSSISVGQLQNAAIKSDGTLWAWGRNNAGELGDGTTISKSSTVQIGTLTNWIKVSTSISVTFAIKSDGTLWGWGLGTSGQLGDGTTVSKSSPIQIGTLTNWSEVIAGNNSVSAIKTDGTLWSWGTGSDGILGDGTTVNQSSPIQVGTLTTWAKLTISRSSGRTSAIDTSGRLWAWGNNAGGRLGDGTTTSKSSPVQIGGSRNWLFSSNGDNAIYVAKNNDVFLAGGNSSGQLGDSSTVDKSSPVLIGAQGYWGNTLVAGSQGLVITKVNNTLWAWGRNNYGQIGDSTTVPKSSPVQIGTLSVGGVNWRSVAAGNIITLAIKTDGTLWSWGSGVLGGLGTNDINDKSSPVQVGTQNWWRQVATDGNSSYGITNTNALFSWGQNVYGELGLDDTGINRSSPTQIAAGNWDSVSAGDGWALALTTPAANSGGGNLYATGINNRGQLGLGDTNNRQLFTLIDVGGDLWACASAGGSSGYAIKKDGTLWSWGENGNGELGNSSVTNRSFPVQIGTLTNWATVVASTQVGAVFATKTDGTLWFWGNNSNGQVGNGVYPIGTFFSSPVQVGTLTTWSSITSGGQAYGAINNNASLYAWGDNSDGNLAQNALILRNRSSPVQLSSDTWSYANATTNAISAIKPNGSLWVWGNNVDGRLGDGTTVIKVSPVQIGTLTNWSKTYAGSQQMYALKTDGTLWTWGNNSTGQLGIGTTLSRSSPVQIGTLTNWVEVGALTATAFAINSTNQLYAWGRGANGGLGDGTTTNKSSPVQIGTLTNWSKVAAGNNFGFAVKTDGTLWSWGNNANGRLGSGTTISRSSPVQIGTLNNWFDVFSRDASAFAIKTDGTLWSWGQNTNGQTGDGTTVNKSSPVQIGTLTNWSKGSSSSSGSTMVVLKTDGTLWTWGQNNNGQLGDGTSINKSSPIQIGSATDWTLPLGGLTSGGLKTV